MSTKLTAFFISVNVFLFLFVFMGNLYIAAEKAENENKITSLPPHIMNFSNRTPIPVQEIANISNTTEEVLSASESIQLQKESYSIAILGDSMVETMGENLDYLKQALEEKYPDTNFKLYNYGIGSSKTTDAGQYFEKGLSNGKRSYPSISNLKPDVIILGSFAYNPFNEHNRDKHWIELAGLIKKAKEVTQNTYLMAEIAPLEDNFGKGPGGIVWSEDFADKHVLKILEQMENVFGLSKELEVPVINAYEASLKDGSKYGKVEYVDDHDGIHPSEEGNILTAEKIVETVKFDLEESSSE